MKLVNGNHKANPRKFELGFYSNNSGILVFHRVSVYWGSKYFVCETFSIVFKHVLKIYFYYLCLYICVYFYVSECHMYALAYRSQRRVS